MSGTGQEQRQFVVEKRSTVTAPRDCRLMPCDDYLVVGDYEGYLHVLKREDGSFVARLRTDGSAILTPPVTLGDGALVQTSDGELYSVAIH